MTTFIISQYAFISMQPKSRNSNYDQFLFCGCTFANGSTNPIESAHSVDCDCSKCEIDDGVPHLLPNNS